MIQGFVNKKQASRLHDSLVELPKTMRNKILRQELRKAGKRLVAPAKANTPMQSGRLRQSVKLRAMKRSRSSVGVLVGYGDKDFTGNTFYGGFIEWGWRLGKRKSKADKSADTRRKIGGRYTLAKLAESMGPSILSAAMAAIAYRVTRMWRNG